MRIRDLLRISFKNTFRNFRNTSLSVCAIAIGISAVMLITGLGGSTQLYAQAKLADLGVDGLSLRIDGVDEKLDPKSARAIEENVPGADACIPFVYDTASALVCKKSNAVISWGVGERLSYGLGLKMLYGRDIDGADIQANRRVAVVDEKLAIHNYSRSNIVGKQIRLQINGKNEYFEVIGVIQSQSDSFSSLIGGELDSFVYIPYTVQNEMNASSGVSQIAIKCTSGSNNAEVCAEVLKFMQRQYPINGQYCIENISSYIEQVKEIIHAVVMMITAIGGISLIVAGIGVMNGMISGVAQRKREIGLYMSVGALSRDIICDIILETGLICCVGGVFGVLAGSLAVWGISDILGIAFVLDLQYIGYALLMCVLCSVFFGLAPALKAAATEPIDALRTMD